MKLDSESLGSALPRKSGSTPRPTSKVFPACRRAWAFCLLPLINPQLATGLDTASSEACNLHVSSHPAQDLSDFRTTSQADAPVGLEEAFEFLQKMQ